MAVMFLPSDQRLHQQNLWWGTCLPAAIILEHAVAGRSSRRLRCTFKTQSGSGTWAVSPTLAPQAWKLMTACSLRPMLLATCTNAR